MREENRFQPMYTGGPGGITKRSKPMMPAGRFNSCRTCSGAALLLIGLLLTAGIAANAIGGNAGAGEMALFGGSLGNVSFPHSRHQEALQDCSSCHQLFPQTAGVVQKLIRQNQLKKKEVMNQCTQCHRDRAASNKRSGPIKCRDCHRKA